MCGGDDHLAQRLVSWKRAKGCIPGGTPSLHVGAFEVFQSLYGHSSDSTLPLFSLQLRVLKDRNQFRSWFSLKSPSWRRVGGRLIRSDSHQSSDSLVEMSDELAFTLASIQEFMLTVKFRMLDIRCYSGIGYPKIHLRLYNTFMRAHGINDWGNSRWFALVEPLRLRTQEDMAHEFLTQDAFEATERPNESISSFVNRWRAKVVGMIDRPKKRDQIDMVLRNLQPRFTRRLVGIPFQDLKSLVHATFSVKEAIAQGLWMILLLSPMKGRSLLDHLPRPSHPRVVDSFPIGVSDSCPLNGPDSGTT
ncbi:hypothetical protein AAG906_021803 [Vitis piasezkii]